MTKDPKKNEKQQYYGTDEKESLTYLEFGGIDFTGGTKSIWDFRIDQEAYDFLMLSRYAKEIIAFNKSLQSIQNGNYLDFIDLYKNDVHTQDFLNSILTFKALELLNKNGKHPKFFELGFTLFGCIDAHEVCAHLLDNNLEVKNIKYRGNEISEFLSLIAQKLHSDYDTDFSLDTDQFEESYDVFFAKGVTLLYAINKPEQLFNYLDRSNLSIFDYSFSLGEKHTSVLGTGKKVTYHSIKQIISQAESYSQELFIRKSDHILDNDNRLRAHFLWGEEKVVKKYLDELNIQLSDLKNKLDKQSYSAITNNYLENPSEDYVNFSNFAQELLK